GERDSGEEAFSDEDLAEEPAAAALALRPERLAELGPRQVALVDEQPSKRSPSWVRAGFRVELRLGLEQDTVLLGECAGEGERRERPPLDEDLADEAAGPPLLGQRRVELLLREEPFLDEQRSERPPGIARAKHRSLI